MLNNLSHILVFLVFNGILSNTISDVIRNFLRRLCVSRIEIFTEPAPRLVPFCLSVCLFAPPPLEGGKKCEILNLRPCVYLIGI